jgi:hypothetical protein
LDPMTETVIFPKRTRGRPSPAAEALYQRQVRAFCDLILEIRSTLDFDVSARGWGYILENRGIITKADLDTCERLINDCRKSGELPLDICAVDQSREFENVECLDEADPEDAAARVLHTIRAAHFDYNPISFWDFQDDNVQMVVEKIDLRSLFGPVCREFHVPVANGKGWSDLHLRADMMERFQHWEDKGKRPVLLYCGDHDPAGIHISENLHSNLHDLSEAVGWDPGDLVIERFGLNEDFITQHGLTWIDNLITSSGQCLSDHRHNDHRKPYVQDYLTKYGIRKVEANALVVAPEAGRALCRQAIEQYINPDGVAEYQAALEEERTKLAEGIRRLLKEESGD